MVWCTASVLDAVAFAEGFKVFEGELGDLIQVGHNYVANRHVASVWSLQRLSLTSQILLVIRSENDYDQTWGSHERTSKTDEQSLPGLPRPSPKMQGCWCWSVLVLLA